MRRAQLERRLPRYLSSIPKTELPHVVDEENQRQKALGWWGGGRSRGRRRKDKPDGSSVENVNEN